MGKEPCSDDWDIYQMIGKECYILLERTTKGNKVYYSVKELVKDIHPSPLPNLDS